MQFESTERAASFAKEITKKRFEAGIQWQCVESSSQASIVRYLQCWKKNGAIYVVSAAGETKSSIKVFSDE